MVFITERDIENIQQGNITKRIRILPHIYLNVSKNTMPLKKIWYYRDTKEGNVCLGEFNPSRRGRGADGHVSFNAVKEFLAQKLLERRQARIAERRGVSENNPLFSDMCESWYEAYKARSRETTSINAKKIVRKYIEPCPFYNKRMKEITRREIVELADTCAKGSVKKLLGFINNIFDFAYKRGFYVPEAHTSATAVVPTVADLDYDYAPQNFKALIYPTEFGILIRKVKGYLERNFISSRAILFLAYNFCRCKEMLNMQWKDIDLDFENMITLEASKTKQNEILKIPFCQQTKTLLLEIRQYRMDHEEHLRNWRDAYVFHKLGDPFKPMTATALHSFMHKLGYTKATHCLHSFRSSASTMLREQLEQLPEAVERQLGHKLGNKVVQAYNRADYLPQRREMLEIYAEFIDSISGPEEENDCEDRYEMEKGEIHRNIIRIVDTKYNLYMLIDKKGKKITGWQPMEPIERN